MPDRNGDAAVAEQSLAELVKQLSEQTATLAHKEVELAKVEIRQKGLRAGLGAGMFGASGLIGLYALAAATAAAILALATAVAGWLAALIVAGVWAIVAGVLALSGRTEVKKAAPPVPEQASASVREDVEVTKMRASAGRES